MTLTGKGIPLIALLLIPIISGCATLAVRRDETHSVLIYEEPFERTWSSIMQVISGQGETVVYEDKKSGAIATGYEALPIGELFQIGKMPPVHSSSGFRGAWLYGRQRIDYSIQKTSPTTTQVKVTIYLQAYNASGQRWVNIPPNGMREQEIFKELRNLLQKG